MDFAVKKRLIFHFYLGDGWESNLANICHFRCLNLYSGVFDSAMIVITHDGMPEEQIVLAKKKFLEIIKSKELTFKTVENTPYYEAKTFDDEILKKIGEYDGLTFFSHNKGVSNVLKKSISVESILKFIVAAYFLNLSDIREIENRLTGSFGTKFYGAFLLQEKNVIQYVGSIYWLNEGRVKRYCELNGIEMPKCYDRELAERFPGSICGWNNGRDAASPSLKILYECDVYRNIQAPIDFIMDAGQKENFNNLYSRVIEGLGFYKYTILTYNFGGYEIMREPFFKQNDVEYVYVTDDENLTSNVWKIIVDKNLDGLTPLEKVYYVRNHMFDYCSTPICVRIDGSIEVAGCIDGLMDEFNNGGYDIGIMVHPERCNILDEYDEWLRQGRVAPEEKDNVVNELASLGYDVSLKGLYETGLFIVRKNIYTEDFLLKNTANYNKFLCKFGKIRVDQVIFTYSVNTGSDLLRIMPLSHQCIQSNALVSMEHNSCYTCVVHNIPETGYVKGTEKKLYKINA